MPLKLSQQLVRLLADGKLLAGYHLIEKILARIRRIGLVEQARLHHECLNQFGQCLNIFLLHGITGEQRITLGKGLQLGRPKISRFFRAELIPVNSSAGTYARQITRQLQRPMSGQKRMQDFLAILIVNTLGVRLGITIAHKRLH